LNLFVEKFAKFSSKKIAKIFVKNRQKNLKFPLKMLNFKMQNWRNKKFISKPKIC